MLSIVVTAVDERIPSGFADVAGTVLQMYHRYVFYGIFFGLKVDGAKEHEKVVKMSIFSLDVFVYKCFYFLGIFFGIEQIGMCMVCFRNYP